MGKLLNQLKALSLLSESATPGNWTSLWDIKETEAGFSEWDDVVIMATDLDPSATPIERLVIGTIWYDGPHVACTRENAEFIVAARNLFNPDNLVEITNSLSKLESLENENQALKDLILKLCKDK